MNTQRNPFFPEIIIVINDDIKTSQKRNKAVFFFYGVENRRTQKERKKP